VRIASSFDVQSFDVKGFDVKDFHAIPEIAMAGPAAIEQKFES
jgi:hypothetical protein